METVSQYYIEGIKEGRQALQTGLLVDPAERIKNIQSTLKGFSKSSPVGQMLLGELDFWKNQQKKDKGAHK